MGHKNYSKFSEHSNNRRFVNNASHTLVTTLSDEEVTDLKPEDVATVNNDGTLTGVVTGCSKLYVREKPNKESNYLCIIDESSEVMIDTIESTTEDFYKVCTSSGVEGYCMKKYITIK